MSAPKLENIPAKIEGATLQIHGQAARFECGVYDNGLLAIIVKLADGRPWGKLTVNLPDDPLEPGEFHVRSWDEGADLAAAAMATGLFLDTGKRVPTGWVQASVWRIK